MVLYGIVTGRDGYYFTMWTKIPGNGAEFQLENTPVTSNLVLKAVYTGNERNISAGVKDHVAYLNATEQPNSANLLTNVLLTNTGDLVTFKVIADYDFIITGVAVRGANRNTAVLPDLVSQETDAAGNITYTYNFTMPDEDMLIDVYTAPKAYMVVVEEVAPQHGTYTINGDTTNNKMIAQGDKVDIMVDPDAGYRVKSVTVTDAEGNAVPVSFVSEELTYEQVWSFTMPASAVDVVVIFEVQGSSYFTDVRTDFWFYDAVTFVTDRGYFKGLSSEIFGPNINMDRAMFVTVLGRLHGINPEDYTSVSFNDVVAGSYYAPYVAWATANGIVLGRSETMFDPHGDITREEMVTIMYRYSKFIGMDVTAQNAVFMGRYEDLNLVSGFAEDAIKWAVGVGLIRGRSDTTINPLDTACRAEVAQVIKNFCDKVIAP